MCNTVGGFCITSGALATVNSAIELDFTNYELISKSVEKIQTGNIAREQIKSLLKAGKITAGHKTKFKEQAREMYSCFLTAMKAKSPGNKPLSNHISCLNPSLMLEEPDFAKQSFISMWFVQEA